MKINQLLTILGKQPYFTKQNLGLAISKEGEGLNYWIKKLTEEKLVIPLKKGFYISLPFKEKIANDPSLIEAYSVYLANRLRFPSYVSLEYVLAKESIIPETVFAVTSITLKSSRRYTSDQGIYIYRNIKKELFYGYRLTILGNTGLTARIAYPYKALFDLLYLKKFVSVSSIKDYLLESSRINWDALSREDKKNFIKMVKESNSVKMKKIVSILKKEKIL